MPHFLIRDTTKYGRVPERPKGTDCKSVVTDFSGSNPLSPTKQTPNHMIGSLLLQGLVQNQIQHIKKNLILRLYSVMNKKSQAEYATQNYILLDN